MDISNKAVVEFLAKTDRFQSEISGLKKTLASIQKPATDSLSKIQNTLNSVGKSMTKYVTAPLVGAGALAVKEFGAYEHALNGVGKTMNISGQELQDMGKRFQMMGREVPVATNELLEIAAAGAQLGVGAKDIEGFTRTIADMGIATDLSTEQAAMGMAQFMASMGKTSANTDNYNEVMSRLGSTIVDLGNNFSTGETAILEMGQRLVGTAHSVGMTETGVMALSTAMSALGINAQQGGGAMSRVMQKMNTAVLSNSQNLQKFADVAGMSASEFAEVWRTDPIQAIDAFVKGLGDVQESGGDMASLLDELGIKGSQEVDVLSRLAGGHETLSSAIDSANTAWDENSALSEEAKVRYEELQASIQRFKNALSELGASVGKVVGGQFQSLIEGLTKLINKFNDLGEGPKKAIIIFAEVVAAIGPVLLIIAKLIGFIKAVGTALGVIKGAIAAVGAVMAGPIGMIAMIIAGLAALGVALYKHRDQVVEYAQIVKQKAIELKDKVVEVFSNIKQAISTKWQEIVESTRQWWENLKTTISESIEVIKTTISEKFIAIKEFFTTLWESIKAGVVEAWTSIKEIFITIVTGIVTSISEAWSGFVEMLSTVWQTVQEGITTAWTAIKEVFFMVVDIIVAGVMEKWNSLKDTITTVWDAIKGVAQTVWDAIKSVISSLVDSAITTITNLWNDFSSFISGLWNTISSIASSVWTVIKTTISNLVQSAVTTLKNLWNQAKAFITNLWNSIKVKASSVFSQIASIVSNLSNRAKTAISNAWNSAKSLVTNAINRIKSTVSNGFSRVVSTVISKGSQIVSGVRNAFSNAISAARSFISRAVSIGRDLILGFVNGVKQKASALIGAVKGAVGGAINAAKNLLGIGSPSRVFRRFAKWTMQGYQFGIRAKEDGPINAMKKTASNIIEAFDPVNALTLPSLMNSSLNTEITHKMALGVNQPRPANINLVLGKRDYYGQVNDITDTQDKDIELKERYGFNV